MPSFLSFFSLFPYYKVSPTTGLVDKCQNNQSLCSNGCKFSYDDLRFTCTCPDYLYLINTTTCIYPSKWLCCIFLYSLNIFSWPPNSLSGKVCTAIPVSRKNPNLLSKQHQSMGQELHLVPLPPLVCVVTLIFLTLHDLGRIQCDMEI